MRVLTDEQFNELTEHIKQLEAENRYLKKLIDDAGISYDKTDAVPKKNEQQITGIKDDILLKIQKNMHVTNTVRQKSQVVLYFVRKNDTLKIVNGCWWYYLWILV